MFIGMPTPTGRPLQCVSAPTRRHARCHSGVSQPSALALPVSLTNYGPQAGLCLLYSVKESMPDPTPRVLLCVPAL
eukprot:3726133-Rhodomonas_salina.3